MAALGLSERLQGLALESQPIFYTDCIHVLPISSPCGVSVAMRPLVVLTRSLVARYALYILLAARCVSLESPCLLVVAHLLVLLGHIWLCVAFALTLSLL